MKKTLLLLSLIPLISQAKEFNFNLKSDIKVNQEISKDLDGNHIFETSYQTTPISFSATSKDKKLNFGLVFKSKRDNFFTPDTVLYAKSAKAPYIEGGIKEINGKKLDELNFKFYDSTTIPFTHLEDIPLAAKTQHHHHHHHHGHSHDHSHDHNHDHDHEEHEDNLDESYTLELRESRKYETLKANNDFQTKIFAEYNPSKFLGAKLTFYPTGYNEENRRYDGKNFKLEAKVIHLINENTSISLNPKYYTLNYISPLLAENNLALKHKLKNEAVLSSNLFSALQLNILDEKYRFENKIDLSYDKSKESMKFHEFYEIVDHEHEKLEQTKFNAFFSHKGTYIKNADKNGKFKFDGKGDEYNYGFNFNFKKQNFLTKGLEFKNDFSISRELRKTQIFKWYNSVAEIHSDLDRRPSRWSDRTTAKETHFEKDRSKIEFVEERIFFRTNRKYYIKNTLTPLEKEGDKKIVINKLDISNKTKASWKYKRVNFELTNEFSLKKDFLKDEEDKLTNKFLLNAQRRFKGYYVINPRIGNETKYFKKELVEGVGKAIETSILTGVDLKYVKNEGNLKLETGLDLGADLQFRKANKDFFLLTSGRSEENIASLPEGIQEYIKKERDKFVFGPKFTIRPHFDATYKLSDNLSVGAKAEVLFTASKDVNKRVRNNYSPVYDKVSFKETKAKVALKLDYTW